MNIKTIVNSKMIRLNKSENYLLVQIAGQADGAKSEKLIFGRICYLMYRHPPFNENPLSMHLYRVFNTFGYISHTLDCNGTH